ncbi:unnamed protein product, partial [Sphacelaria rigidula]
QEHCQTAVTQVRSQAIAVRKTAAEYLKGELLRGERQTNGDPKWPAVLGSFHIAANQVAELVEDVDPVLSYFAYQPLRATAKPGDIPTFLSTKLLPRNDGDMLEKRHGAQRADDGQKRHVDAVARFNQSVADVSTSYQVAADELLGELSSSSAGVRS